MQNGVKPPRQLPTRTGNWKYRLVLLAAATIFLNACASGTSSCPPWPVAGPEVAAELEQLPPKAFPAFWEWMNRLANLRDQLEICR